MIFVERSRDRLPIGFTNGIFLDKFMLLQSAIELRLDSLHTANKHVCLRTVLTQGRLKIWMEHSILTVST